MGKGFNNYMTKKFFHPASKDNIKRVWMAEQKTVFEKKKQEDLMNQYQKEQDMLSNRALLGDEKAKLGLSFLYDAPPGMKKKEVEDEGEQEVKFEWQRKYNAPRESYAKDDEMIRDQPFGIEVRNVRCIKCRQWGHVNTDKICPLFGKNLTAEPPMPETATSSLIDGLKDDGFRMKKSVMGRLMEGEDERDVLGSGEEDDPEVQFLKSLTPKQKKKLLKQLSKLQSKNDGKMKKRKKDKSKKKKKSKMSESESEFSDDERERSRRSHHDHRQNSERDVKYKIRLSSSDRDVKPKKLKHTSRESERRMERRDKHGQRCDSSSSDSSSEIENERGSKRGMKGNSKDAYKERNRSLSEDEWKVRRNEDRKDERKARDLRERDGRRERDDERDRSHSDGRKEWNARMEREERMQREDRREKEERRERDERRERGERRERDERRNNRRNDSDSDESDRKKLNSGRCDSGDEYERRERGREDRRRERSRSRERMERREEKRHRR